ncbi:4Fe-4S dicluster domain-containing protein [Seohaeicola saemankumensis]|nr:4Fe-4S dicluster domain-containing protein [Seohaeicola saemankumensis]MCA0870619.1 4Fe-4S dicluster domain-containing protein [Seohaeicola saemankumensis]
MARANPYRPFTPDPEQTARAPDVSGNAINGLGETAHRRPRMVYWAPDPDDIPHGELQRYFYTQSARVAAFADKRAARQAVLDAPLPPVADRRVTRPPDEWTAALDDFIANGACEKTGVARMQPDWVYDGHHIPQSRVIMIGVAHDYDAIATAPDPRAGLEVMQQYTRAAAAAKTIAGWLRQQGWEAEPVTGPMTGALAMIPPALACGFGELGKHGSLINPDMGASFRLSAVLTDAPFAPTPPQSHGIDAFCQNCRICEDACPPEALSPDKQTVRGTTKWYVDFDKCLPFFNQTHGCAICIAQCPWSRPGVGLNLAAKLARKRQRDAD